MKQIFKTTMILAIFVFLIFPVNLSAKESYNDKNVKYDFEFTELKYEPIAEYISDGIVTIKNFNDGENAKILDLNGNIVKNTNYEYIYKFCDGIAKYKKG